MKISSFLLMLVILSGCSSLSTEERKELTFLRCEKVFSQISELRNASREGALYSLGFALHENGFSETIVYGMLELAESEEAHLAFDRKYKSKLDDLSLSLLKSSGCLQPLEDSLLPKKPIPADLKVNI